MYLKIQGFFSESKQHVSIFCLVFLTPFLGSDPKFFFVKKKKLSI
jgi:hypothetical protein